MTCRLTPLLALHLAAIFALGREPVNVGDAKLAAIAYHDSGAYARDLERITAEAQQWIASRSTKVQRPAVLDVDETALSNWEVLRLERFRKTGSGTL